MISKLRMLTSLPHFSKTLLRVILITSGVFIFFWNKTFYGYEHEIYQAGVAFPSISTFFVRSGISSTLLYLPWVWVIKSWGLDINWATSLSVVLSISTVVTVYLILEELYPNSPRVKRFNINEWTTYCIGFCSAILPTSNFGMDTHSLFYLTLLFLFLIRFKNKKASLVAVGLLTVLFVNSKFYFIATLPIVFGYIYFVRSQVIPVKFWVCTTGLAVLSLFSNIFIFHSILGAYSAFGESAVVLGQQLWWEGYYGVLFSISKGIFWTSPVLLMSLVGVRKFEMKFRAEFILIALLFAALYLINTSTPGWSDERWMCRGMVIVFPLVLLPLREVLADLVFSKRNFLQLSVVLFLLGSFYIQVLGCLYSYRMQLILLREANTNLDTKIYLRYVPHLAPAVIHHELFKSYLNYLVTGSGNHFSYREKSYRRNELYTDQALIHDANIDLKPYHTPSLWWIGAL
jgi:hypothetical protein